MPYHIFSKPPKSIRLICLIKMITQKLLQTYLTPFKASKHAKGRFMHSMSFLKNSPNSPLFQNSPKSPRGIFRITDHHDGEGSATSHNGDVSSCKMDGVWAVLMAESLRDNFFSMFVVKFGASASDANDSSDVWRHNHCPTGGLLVGLVHFWALKNQVDGSLTVLSRFLCGSTRVDWSHWTTRSNIRTSSELSNFRVGIYRKWEPTVNIKPLCYHWHSFVFNKPF